MEEEERQRAREAGEALAAAEQEAARREAARAKEEAARRRAEARAKEVQARPRTSTRNVSHFTNQKTCVCEIFCSN
jgi:hypothetical protein